MAIEDVGSGQIASIVTYLEMSSPPQGLWDATPTIIPEFLHLAQMKDVDCNRYRTLFRAVGAPWLWFSRLEFDDVELEVVLKDPSVDVFIVQDGACDVGLVEIDRREKTIVELAFIGLISEYIGRGLGSVLLDFALRQAWQPPCEKVVVHTCTFDHPKALHFYKKAGFVPVKYGVEIAPDPRLRGLLPMDCAPNIPII